MRAGHSHAGVQSIDYLAYQSRLSGWNAGFKVVFAVVTLVLAVAANDLWVSLTLLAAMSGLVVCAGGLPFGVYLRLLRIPAPFLLLSVLTIACDISRLPQGEFCLDLGWFCLHTGRAALWGAALLLARAFGAVSAMYFMTLTTPACEIVGVMRCAHLPGLVVELMYLIYRFIFILLGVHSRMRTAAASRLGYRDFRTSCRSFSGTAGNLLVLSMRKANTYYDAMLSRCYAGDMRFLEPVKPVTARQIACAAAVWAAAAAAWLLM